MPVHSDYHEMLSNMVGEYCDSSTKDRTKDDKDVEGFPGKTCSKARSVFYATCNEQGWEPDKPRSAHLPFSLTNRFEVISEAQRRDPGWKPFPWCMNWKMYRNMGGVLIYGEALHPTVTRNMDEYTRDEIEKAARMLIGKPLELDLHGQLMTEGNNVLDAEPVNGNIQYIARVMDEETIKRLPSPHGNGDIRWVSFNGMCRFTPDYIPGVEPRGCRGLLLFRLCLVGESSPLPPGDPNTSVHVWATVQKHLTNGFYVKAHGEVARICEVLFVQRLREAIETPRMNASARLAKTK